MIFVSEKDTFGYRINNFIITKNIIQMKSTFLLFSFLIFSFSLFAQFNAYDPLPPYDPPTFTWGDRYYEKNLEGLGFLMTDLRTLDPELYQSLRSRYNALKRRNQEARSIAIGGGVIGGALLIVGVMDSGPSKESFGPSSISTSPKGPNINFGLIGGGLLIAGIASIVSYQKSIKHADILNFTNFFNEKSYGEKIYFSIRPEVGVGKNLSGGLALSLRF